MANDLTWYTSVDYAIPDSSSVALQRQSILWTLKALLMGQIAGGTLGPAGALPAGSRWTCYYSCDGTTAGTANDGVDRWTSSFDATKIPNSTGSTARGWFVLKSPAALGPLYLILENHSNGSPAYQGTIAVSKAAPTGGTTTGRPTATDEVAYVDSPITDTAAWGGGRCHLTMETNGSFWYFASKNSQNAISNCIAVSRLKNLRNGSDTWPFCLIVDPSTGPTTSCLRETQNTFYRGSTNGNIRTRAYNPTGPTLTACVATILSFDVGSSTSYLQDQAGTFFGDLLYESNPCLVAMTTAGVKGLKGELYDCTALPLTIATGARYPPTGDIERIMVGSTLVPLTAVPTL